MINAIKQMTACITAPMQSTSSMYNTPRRETTRSELCCRHECLVCLLSLLALSPTLPQLDDTICACCQEEGLHQQSIEFTKERKNIISFDESASSLLITSSDENTWEDMINSEVKDTFLGW
jgi:hypothetical protein